MRQTVHFLHLGKNAGTQFKFCAAQVNAFSLTHRFLFYGHKVPLTDLPEGCRYTFVTRDPVKRFRSGFYSRKRKGQPRTYVEWRGQEPWAFGEFEHANDLAEVLYDDTDRGAAARQAMGVINHVRQHQHSWFDGRPNFLEDWPPVYILRQEHFDADILRLYQILGIEDKPIMAHDKASSHRNDYSATAPLTEKSVENLKRWYQADIDFIDRCDGWRTARFGE